MRNEMGETVGPAPRGSDWTIWWDGDPLREFLSLGRARFGRRFGPRPTTITKWNWQREEMEPIVEFEGVTFSRGPTISGDLLGDWREEVVLVAPDAASLRVYTTTIPTDRRLPTLLHDPQYRLGLVWQNVVYNKPCYPSYYLGDGMAEPPRPAIRVAGGGESIAEGD